MLHWGGTPAGFHVTYLKDRHYRFSVASKQVGFAICDLKRITTNHVDVYFHLWRDGGDNWIREWRKWQEKKKNLGNWFLIIEKATGSQKSHFCSSDCSRFSSQEI
jgi:hypothetical protein